MWYQRVRIPCVAGTLVPSGEVCSRCGTIYGSVPAASTIDQSRTDQVVEHAGHDIEVVLAEALVHLDARDRLVAADVLEDRFPDRAAFPCPTLPAGLHSAVVGAKRHAEHVGDNLLAHPVTL